MLKAAIKPATIYPDEKAFLALYQNNFFKGKSMIFVDKNQVLFQSEPSLAQIKEQLALLLDADYSEEYLLKIKSILGKILQKGKAVTVSDFQDCVQDALETPQYKQREIFSVVDFEVTTGKDRAPHASVIIKNCRRRAQGNGSGCRASGCGYQRLDTCLL